MKPNEIFVIEDNDTMRLGMVETLKRENYNVNEFANPSDALESFFQNPVSILITDLKMEPISGIEVLQKVKKFSPQTEVLVVSAFGNVENAVNAMKLGAADFLTKPFSTEELRLRVKKMFEKVQNKNELEKLHEKNRFLNQELFPHYENLIGKSEAIENVFEMIERVAKEDCSVLLEGESGTGKELVASAIHQKSLRKNESFIKVNCGALNDNLLESELFGHEKGAFTNAFRQKKGRFELSDKGTLFMDEIGDISQVMQVKLLRVLQEGEFERVGGETTLKTDVRIISATHRNFTKLISEQKFREDLYYRLNVIPIKIPALRERREDIPLLVNYFFQKLAKKRNQPPKVISEEGMNLLQNYSWNGNVRELENVVERLNVVSPKDEIDTNLVAQFLGEPISGLTTFENLPLMEAVDSFEKNLIVNALKKCNGVKNQAAKMLGVRTSALYYKLEKYGLM
ncbi:MAG: sigma-54-dependent Fis family transcriptional regulator [Calditrichaeota bacterium]|nr:MAG: sigma-54-dependent Fis family transcriptional regulator [Calditrichota bacterium]